MSETAPDSSRPETAGRRSSSGGGRRGTSREPAMLPPWGIEIARLFIRTASGVLWRMRLHGVENIPLSQDGGLIIAANHQTYFDPFWISIPVKRPMRYLAWNEALKWPLLGRLMELLGAWPLQLTGGDPTAIRRSLQWLRGGGAILIFPEGARAEADGEMERFKPGAARIALEANVPILPVTIRGAHRVWPRGGGRVPRLGRVEIFYHPLYNVEMREGEDARACARRVSLDLTRIIGEVLKKH